MVLTSSQSGASVGSWVIVLSRDGTVKSTSVNPPPDWGNHGGGEGGEMKNMPHDIYRETVLCTINHVYA